MSSSSTGITVSTTDSQPVKALLPVASGNEEVEFTALFNVLGRGGIEVTVASVEDTAEAVVLQKGLRVLPDCTLAEAAGTQWDAIVMAGGVPGAMNLAASDQLRRMLQDHYAAGRLVGAICLSPALVLEPAGVLANSRRATCNPMPIKTPAQEWPPDEFTSRLGDRFDRDARVCVDEENRVITSQAPGTAIEFALAVVTMLQGEAVAKQISDYILLR